MLKVAKTVDVTIDMVSRLTSRCFLSAGPYEYYCWYTEEESRRIAAANQISMTSGWKIDEKGITRGFAKRGA